MTIGGADDRLATDEVDCVAPVEVTGAELTGIVFMMALFWGEKRRSAAGCELW